MLLALLLSVPRPAALAEDPAGADSQVNPYTTSDQARSAMASDANESLAAAWQSGGPYGANIRALAIDPTTPTTLYAATSAGVFKSTNSGGTWSAVNAGLTNLAVIALAIDPTNPATIYAGTSGAGAFKSTDSGVTWAAVNAGLTNLNVNHLALDPIAPATLYAGTYGGVFKSTTPAPPGPLSTRA